MNTIANGTIINCTETGKAFIARCQHGDANYLLDTNGRVYSIEGAVARTRRAVIERQMSTPVISFKHLAVPTRH